MINQLPSDLTLTEAETLAGGSWRVTYYYDNGDGVSNDFDGYTFDISDDGTLTATKGASIYTGVWMVKSSDDDPTPASLSTQILPPWTSIILFTRVSPMPVPSEAPSSLLNRPKIRS